MNHKRLAPRPLATIVFVAVGCAKPELTITNLTVASCRGGDLDYSYTFENRNYTSNGLVHPGGVARSFTVQGWLSSTTALNENDAGDRPAGGRVFDASDFGPDQVLTPGESVSSTGRSRADSPIDVSATPNLILKVDARNVFDPEMTTEGKIDEYNEANNEKSVPIGTCN